MGSLHQYFEFATFIITILGVPAAIFIYLKEQKLQREENEYGTYDALDDKYIDLQQLCLEYPELDIFDTPYETPKELNEEQKKQEEAILLIRISIFERAFLMYRRSPSKSKLDQWEGWDIEIKEWLERDNFRKVWEEQSPYFDKAFADHYNQCLAVT
jgi:hypothetical protein